MLAADLQNVRRERPLSGFKSRPLLARTLVGLLPAKKKHKM
jgi:hypothetical protein